MRSLKPPEKRKHNRFTPPDGSLALVFGSMSKVLDISKGGLSLMLLGDIETGIPKVLSLDLLSSDHSIKARKIQGKLAWNKDVFFSSYSEMVFKKIGVQFDKLSLEQRNQLDKIIRSYLVGFA